MQRGKMTWLRRAQRHLADLRDWPNTDKCILAAGVVLPFSLWNAAVAYYLITHIEYAPYVDRSFLAGPLRIHVGLFIPAWVAIIVTALAFRHHPVVNRVLPHVLTILYFVWFACCSYFFGTHTSLFPAVILLSGATAALVLWGRSVALPGIVVFNIIIGATTIAEQAGLIRYAPVLAAAPFRAGRLDNSWLVSMGGAEVMALMAAVAIIYVIVQSWHEHEEKLARAAELISRYVAAQVAEQILAGNYHQVDRHDRRKLTLVFADVKDFTAISDRLEPEDLSRILNRYLGEMVAIAERHGGTIDKFIGDAILVFFGAPTATHDRDHALRAVRMAIEMQRRIAALRGEWRAFGLADDFEVRVGVNTGIATVGNFGAKGRMDYTAIGRQVNLAARLQVQCAPGSILMSHATWMLVHDEIDCRAQGEVHVKGIEQAVRVYAVAAEASAAVGEQPLLSARAGQSL
jgi:class 3 adenylate cyclase